MGGGFGWLQLSDDKARRSAGGHVGIDLNSVQINRGLRQSLTSSKNA